MILNLLAQDGAIVIGKKEWGDYGSWLAIVDRLISESGSRDSVERNPKLYRGARASPRQVPAKLRP